MNSSEEQAALDGLSVLASALAGARTVNEVCAAIIDHAARAFDAQFVNIALLSEDRASVQLVNPSAVAAEVAERWRTIPLTLATPVTDAIRTDMPIHVLDLDELAERYPLLRADATFCSIAAYPLVHQAGAVRASVGLGWTRPHEALPIGQIAPILALCGAALERALVSDELASVVALLDTLLREAPIGIALLDTELRFQRINPKLAEINEVEVAEVLGKTPDVLPDIAAVAPPYLRRVLETGEACIDIELHLDLAGPKRARDRQASYYPIPGPDGSIAGLGVIVEDITERKARERELVELARRNRDIAEALQRGLLPTRLPAPPGYRVISRYEASVNELSIGGDWYDCIEISDDDYRIVIGDVVGHDLDAAIAMSQIRNALAGLSHAESDPARVLERVDEYVAHAPALVGTTLFYGRLRPSSGELVYSSAGHPPPVVVARGSSRLLDGATGLPIGVAAMSRPSELIEIELGEVLVCYTDGLVERRSRPIDEGIAALSAILDSASADELTAIAEQLIAELPESPRRDDVALLLVNRTG